ncbi:MAG: 2-phospho-L-lactate guanylyltransferase, partial [Tepidiformaceae bacterium]
MGKPVALIPLNDLSRAKGRLAEVLSPEHRAGLATATFATVALAAERAGLEVVVLAANPPDLDGYTGVTLLPERPGVTGLNAQLEAALAGLPASDVLVLHADLPLARAAELQRVIEAAPPAPSVTLVESRDGGTNVMLLRPRGTFPLHYGRGSFALHVAAARAAGVAVCVVESDTLSLDLDTPE